MYPTWPLCGDLFCPRSESKLRWIRCVWSETRAKATITIHPSTVKARHVYSAPACVGMTSWQCFTKIEASVHVLSHDLSEDISPCAGPLGQLTSLGYRQCRSAGAELRRRYPMASIRAFSTATR